MSYEYKDNVIDAVDNWFDYGKVRLPVLEEIKHVYAQAAKADEYEAKAKSWDKLMFEIDEINDEAAGKELPSKIIMAAKITALSNVIKEHESGEPNAKK